MRSTSQFCLKLATGIGLLALLLPGCLLGPTETTEATEPVQIETVSEERPVPHLERQERTTYTPPPQAASDSGKADHAYKPTMEISSPEPDPAASTQGAPSEQNCDNSEEQEVPVDECKETTGVSVGHGSPQPLDPEPTDDDPPGDSGEDESDDE